jgi:hypothetical protein
MSWDGVRTYRRLFRRLHVADPRLIELRAWSRLTEELKEEQRRLSNRVGQQLWRYYPQMQKLTDELAAPWFLELWTIAPTPAKARALRKPTVERLLREHRIRRVNADTVLATLRKPAIKVADGVAEAASIHLRSLIARLRVVNRELHEAEGQLDPTIPRPTPTNSSRVIHASESDPSAICNCSTSADAYRPVQYYPLVHPAGSICTFAVMPATSCTP